VAKTSEDEFLEEVLSRMILCGVDFSEIASLRTVFWGSAMLLSEYGTRIHQYEEINGSDIRRRGDLTFMIFKFRGRSEPTSVMW
jgi:hypothetical protein